MRAGSRGDASSEHRAATDGEPRAETAAAASAASAGAAANGEAASSMGETPAADGDAAPSGASNKRQRLEAPAHPLWLVRLLSLDGDAATAATQAALGGSNTTAAHAWPVDGPGWARRVLLLATILRRLSSSATKQPLYEPSIVAAARKLLPMATRAVDDTELQLCALTALLALVPNARAASTSTASSSSTSSGGGGSAREAVWEEVWAQVWAAERSLWTSDREASGMPADDTTAAIAGAPPASAATSGHLCRLRPSPQSVRRRCSASFVSASSPTFA